MKKLIIPLLMLVCFQGYGQEKFSTYENNYIFKTYNIRISTEENEKFRLWIDAMSFDKLHDKGGISIDSSKYKAFIESVNQAKVKYVEWIKTAKDNNVKEVAKPMDISCSVDAYFYYGDVQFQFNDPLDFEFKIISIKDITKYLLTINTGELQSSNNQFMKVDGLALVFTSVNDIDKFLDNISFQKINNYLTKPKAKDLFK